MCAGPGRYGRRVRRRSIRAHSSTVPASHAGRRGPGRAARSSLHHPTVQTPALSVRISALSVQVSAPGTHFCVSAEICTTVRAAPVRVPGDHHTTRRRPDRRDNERMRLASTHATVQRIWTVHLRPQTGGPALACPAARTAPSCKPSPHAQPPSLIWPAMPAPTRCPGICAPASAGRWAATGTPATAAARGPFCSP